MEKGQHTSYPLVWPRRQRACVFCLIRSMCRRSVSGRTVRTVLSVLYVRMYMHARWWGLRGGGCASTHLSSGPVGQQEGPVRILFPDLTAISAEDTPLGRGIRPASPRYAFAARVRRRRREVIPPAVHSTCLEIQVAETRRRCRVATAACFADLALGERRSPCLAPLAPNAPSTSACNGGCR